MNTNNPLMNINFKDLNYNNITADNFEEALEHYLLMSEKEYKNFLNIKNEELTWNDFELNFQNERKLIYVYKLLNFYISIDSSDELNAVFVKYQNQIDKFSTSNMTNQELYKKISYFKNTQLYNQLLKEQKKYIDEYLISFEKNGVYLEDENKEKLIELKTNLSKLQNNYNVNLQKTRDNLYYKVKLNELSGLSEEYLKKAASYLEDKNKEENMLNIPYSSGLFSILQTYCDNPKVRQEVFEILSTIGVQQEYNNIPIAQEIINTNQKIANLLKFKTASHMLMQGNMVQSPKKVLDFLSDLKHQSHELYKKETQEYNDYAIEMIGENHKISDRAYILNKIYEQKYNINTIELSNYFPESQVLKGTFSTLEKLYQIKIKPKDDVLLNKKDIKIFSIFDKNDLFLGDLILDLYQRKGKRNGGCCGNLISREVYDTNPSLNSLPIVYIISNGEPSLEKEPLFTFDNLVTLYHELGHALHHFFSTNKLACFNGTQKVQRDAVELPSQFMENFCYNEDVLNAMSSHIHKKETIPMDLIHNIIESKKFFANTNLMRHILASYIDINLYSNKECNIQDVEIKAIKKHIIHTNEYESLIETPRLFHIFTAGYSSRLYVYKWADVLSADAFAAVKEQGDNIEQQAIMTLKFKEEIYAKGGLDDMNINFINYRGREPNNIAFLENLGAENLQHQSKNKNKL